MLAAAIVLIVGSAQAKTSTNCETEFAAFNSATKHQDNTKGMQAKAYEKLVDAALKADSMKNPHLRGVLKALGVLNDAMANDIVAQYQKEEALKKFFSCVAALIE